MAGSQHLALARAQGRRAARDARPERCARRPRSGCGRQRRRVGQPAAAGARLEAVGTGREGGERPAALLPRHRLQAPGDARRLQERPHPPRELVHWPAGYRIGGEDQQSILLGGDRQRLSPGPRALHDPGQRGVVRRPSRGGHHVEPGASVGRRPHDPAVDPALGLEPRRREGRRDRGLGAGQRHEVDIRARELVAAPEDRPIPDPARQLLEEPPDACLIQLPRFRSCHTEY